MFKDIRLYVDSMQKLKVGHGAARLFHFIQLRVRATIIIMITYQRQFEVTKLPRQNICYSVHYERALRGHYWMYFYNRIALFQEGFLVRNIVSKS